MDRSEDNSNTQERRHERHQNLEAYQSAFPHVQTVHIDITKQMEKVLDENQPRERAGFRKGYLTVDHLQTINQLKVKCNEFERPLCIGYIG